ncbi:MAG TPA: hypothetical protein VGH34_18355 [Vicinamibacterales bacterium]|jgi:hypothetical protein
MSGNDNKATVTVEDSLTALSEAVGKSADDLRGVRSALDLARADLAHANTSITREVVKYAEEAIVHLRETDQALRRVLTRLRDRD